MKINRNHDYLYLKSNTYDKPKQVHLELSKIINKKLKNTKSKYKHVIDIGCANGELIYLLNKIYNKCNYTGYDVLKPLIQKAKKKMKNIENIKFKYGSVLNKNLIKKSSGTAIILSGVLSMFDNFEKVISNLIYWTKNKGEVVIYGVFNDNPIDVFIKYRKTSNYNKFFLESGWNTFSKQSISNYLNKKKEVEKFKFKKFNIKFNLKKNKNDLLRTWTFKNQKGNRLTTNGLNVIFQLYFLTIRVKK